MSNEQEAIEPQHIKQMNDIANVLDEVFNGPDCTTEDKKTGFALLIFPFEDIKGTGRVNYISNGQREDVLTSMKEFIARAEGRYDESAGVQ